MCVFQGLVFQTYESIQITRKIFGNLDDDISTQFFGESFCSRNLYEKNLGLKLGPDYPQVFSTFATIKFCVSTFANRKLYSTLSKIVKSLLSPGVLIAFQKSIRFQPKFPTNICFDRSFILYEMKIEIKRYRKIFVGAPGSKNVLRTVNFQFYNFQFSKKIEFNQKNFDKNLF